MSEDVRCLDGPRRSSQRGGGSGPDRRERGGSNRVSGPGQRRARSLEPRCRELGVGSALSVIRYQRAGVR